jgi:SAM-dependent methyltransferase
LPDEKYFETRMSEHPMRDSLWRVLCGYLSRYIPPGSRVLELGGGHCCFINHIPAAEKHVVDLFEGVARYAAQDVQTHIGSCADLTAFGDGSFDVVFASNLFEHLSLEQLAQTLDEAARVLKREGRLIVIQPNFKYCYRSYFDDYTHVSVHTHISLVDLLLAHGLRTEVVRGRFLPFSLRSRGPKWPWLAWLYLRSPWRPAAAQMLIVARKGPSS